jgi:hypothetical protein
MASLSVKNRVAMFEGGKDDENLKAPIKHPSTPRTSSFKKPTTPNTPVFGQSFLKPATPQRAKSSNGRELNLADPRPSWPWPTEESVIPAPDMALPSRNSGYQRSSLHASPSSGSVALSQNLPMSKSSVQNIPVVLPQSFNKVQTPFESSPLKKASQSPTNATPIVPTPFRSGSPIPSENKATRNADQATRNKALQLAKSRNSLTIPKPRPVGEPRDDDTLSRSAESEWSSLNGNAITVEEKSLVSAANLGSDGLSLAGSESYQLSRAGKLSQAQGRSNTADPVRSESPSPAVRGTMTLSHVSHKDARKALLQAAQRKKDKADAIKFDEKAKVENVACDTYDEIHEDMKIDEGNVADRVAAKAKNVLKMKNSVLFGDMKTKESSDFTESHRDVEGSCNASVSSTSSRLKAHPAFAARATSPRVGGQLAHAAHLVAVKADGPSKAFSEELFSSFRHFNELRPEPKKIEAQIGKYKNVD